MIARRGVILGCGALLAGCGFRPMFREVGDASVRRELAAIEVQRLNGRVGHLVRDTLLDELNPDGAQVPARYVLQVRLRRRTDALGIQLDNTITRFNLTLTARFRLVERGTGRLLYRSQTRRIASYNAIRQPYAELSAELDAERRAAREVGTDIRTQLAIHFARQAATT